MSINPNHPMLQDEGRPLIATKPIEQLTNAVVMSLQKGRRGIQVHGRGGDGKTESTKYLSKARQWLSKPAPIYWLAIPRRTNGSDSVFYKVIQDGLNLAYHSSSDAIDRLGAIRNRLKTDCQRQGAQRVIIFIDEAQKLTETDYEFIANIDDALTTVGLRLFCVFINQSDDQDIGKHKEGRRARRGERPCAETLPPHIVRRFFMDTFTFTGLKGVAEITHALSRYDEMEFEGRRYTEEFAPVASKNGWKIAKCAPEFKSAMLQLAKENNFCPSSDLPMMIFELTLKTLLVYVAAASDAFTGFTVTDVKDALVDAGYVTLEKSRARQVVQ